MIAVPSPTYVEELIKGKAFMFSLEPGTLGFSMSY